MLLPRVDSEIFSLALEDFAKYHVKHGEKEIVLVMDNAGWHTSKKVKWPRGIHEVFQPPYSPQLQPAERVWQLVDEPFVNRSFDTIEQMEDVAVKRCRQVMDMTDQVSALTHYHWWPQDDRHTA